MQLVSMKMRIAVMIKVFDDSAAPEKFKELTESYSVEDAKARIFDGE